MGWYGMGSVLLKTQVRLATHIISLLLPSPSVHVGLDLGTTVLGSEI